MAYPSRVVPPPARWQGEAAHVGVADYAPEGSDVFMRLYYPTLSRPPRRGPLWVPSVHYAHGMAHFLVDFTNPKRRWWQKLLARAAYLVGYVSNTVFDTIPVTLDACLKRRNLKNNTPTNTAFRRPPRSRRRASRRRARRRRRRGGGEGFLNVVVRFPRLGGIERLGHARGIHARYRSLRAVRLDHVFDDKRRDTAQVLKKKCWMHRA